MRQVVIKYNNPKVLQVLKDFAKYFDFTISIPKEEKGMTSHINGVPFTAGDPSIDTSDLNKIFTGKHINAKELRNKAWQRKK